MVTDQARLPRPHLQNKHWLQQTWQAKSVKPGNSIGRMDRSEISISEQEYVACEITKPKIDERSGADQKLQEARNLSGNQI
jgi:hypothetical protein